MHRRTARFRERFSNGRWIFVPACSAYRLRRLATFHFTRFQAPLATNAYPTTTKPVHSLESSPVDWAKGTDNGLLFHQADGTCWETRWFPPTTQSGVNSGVWANVPASCS
jgi:hypothetical protein